jgi:hypothetical protein
MNHIRNTAIPPTVSFLTIISLSNFCGKTDISLVRMVESPMSVLHSRRPPRIAGKCAPPQHSLRGINRLHFVTLGHHYLVFPLSVCIEFSPQCLTRFLTTYRIDDTILYAGLGFWCRHTERRGHGSKFKFGLSSMAV